MIEKEMLSWSRNQKNLEHEAIFNPTGICVPIPSSGYPLGGVPWPPEKPESRTMNTGHPHPDIHPWGSIEAL